MYIMLTQNQAQSFAHEFQTSSDNVIKEHYQLYILDLLCNSAWEDKLVFKGGTALRLAYGSVRFSEDLDFSLTEGVDFEDFRKTIGRIESVHPEAKVIDIFNKRYIFYARVLFTIKFRSIPMGIKIEVSKVPRVFQSDIKLFRSPFNNLEVLGKVYTLESILADKLRILDNNERREPRDLFDAWFISDKLGLPFIVKEEYKYDHKVLMDRLNAFLPQKYHKVIELFSL